MSYRARIELLLDVNSEAEAADAVSELLRDHLQCNASVDEDTCLVDWRYAVPTETEFGPMEAEPIPLDFDEDSDWPKLIQTGGGNA